MTEANQKHHSDEEQHRSHFDPDKPDTSGDKLICGEWDKHSEDKIPNHGRARCRDTGKTLPQSQSFHKQYTFALKKGHYQALQGRKV